MADPGIIRIVLDEAVLQHTRLLADLDRLAEALGHPGADIDKLVQVARAYRDAASEAAHESDCPAAEGRNCCTCDGAR